MNNEVLKDIATAVLCRLDGPGKWHKNRERPQFEKIKNPVFGLSVGDVVYNYDADDEEMLERQVVAVVDGIGYVLWTSGYWGPLLIPVDNEGFGRTMTEAAELSREQIETDFDYAQRLIDRMKMLKPLLGQ